MVKVTFTLDDLTVAQLRRAAARVAKPQSQVVREAVQEYAARIGRLTERERLQLLAEFDTLVPRIPPRPAGEVDREIKAVRTARRQGGRRAARGPR
jgi:hypothetical protein